MPWPDAESLDENQGSKAAMEDDRRCRLLRPARVEPAEAAGQREAHLRQKRPTRRVVPSGAAPADAFSRRWRSETV
jgi:hypothetical protein